MELNRTHQLLVFVDDVTIVGQKHKYHKEKQSREGGLQVNVKINVKLYFKCHAVKMSSLLN